MVAPTTEKNPSPPYVSFLTFLNFIDWLRDTGIPLRMDRSFWGQKLSGANGAQLMSGLRFLGLLDGDNPTQELEAYVHADAEGRKRELERILRARYYAIFAIGDLSRATVRQLRETLEAYGITGDTIKKAESFFINACKFVDIPLSPGLRKQARNRQAGAQRRRTTTVGWKETPETAPSSRPKTPGMHQQTRTASGSTRRISLKSGGHVVLSVAADLFALSDADRSFLFRLVDMFRDYDRGGFTDAHSRPDEAAVGENGEAPGLQ